MPNRRLLSLILLQASMGVHFDMLYHQCMELRQVTHIAQLEPTPHPAVYRSNGRTLFPHDQLVVGHNSWTRHFPIDHVNRRKILFAFSHDLRLLWCV